MPWRRFVQKWSDAITVSRDAHLLTVDPNQGEVILRLKDPVPSGHSVKLTFPNGKTLTSAPLWQRSQESACQDTVVGFPAKDVADILGSQAESARDRLTRGSPRINTRLWVSFPERKHHGTVTIDLSLEGCRVQGDFRNAQGEVLNLFLDLPDLTDPLYLNAQVVWADGREAGFRFLNLSAWDEARLLRTLGKCVVPPSTFLPGLDSIAPAYTYSLQKTEKESQILLSVANWDVKFTFANAVVAGATQGAFQRLEVLNSSDTITNILSELGIKLEERQKLVHFKLFDNQDRLIVEIAGIETGFQRVKRKQVAQATSEVA